MRMQSNELHGYKEDPYDDRHQGGMKKWLGYQATPAVGKAEGRLRVSDRDGRVVLDSSNPPSSTRSRSLTEDELVEIRNKYF